MRTDFQCPGWIAKEHLFLYFYFYFVTNGIREKTIWKKKPFIFCLGNVIWDALGGCRRCAVAQLHTLFRLDYTAGASWWNFNPPKQVRIPYFPSVWKGPSLPLFNPGLWPAAAFPAVLGIGKASELLLPASSGLCGSWAQLGTATAAVMGKGKFPPPYLVPWKHMQGGGTPPPQRAHCHCCYSQLSPAPMQHGWSGQEKLWSIFCPWDTRKAATAGGEGRKGRGEDMPLSMEGKWEDSYGTVWPHKLVAGEDAGSRGAVTPETGWTLLHPTLPNPGSAFSSAGHHLKT